MKIYSREKTTNHPLVSVLDKPQTKKACKLQALVSISMI